MGVPDITVEKDEKYKTINVNGFFGGMKDMLLEVLFFSQQLDADKALVQNQPDGTRAEYKRIVEARIIIDPQTMKNFVEWLNTKIVEYEKVYGQILTFKESNDKRNPDSMK